MIDYHMWVEANEYIGEDMPTGATPTQAGLRNDSAYRVLGLFDNGNMNEDAYVLVLNDDGELWFLSTRHVRVVAINDEQGHMIMTSTLKENFA